MAAERLRVTWKPTPRLPDLSTFQTALRENPSTPRELIHRGDVERRAGGAAKPIDRTYVWPYHLHGSIGPSCSGRRLAARGARRFGPAPRTRICCGPISRSCWGWRRGGSRSSACRPRAAMAATARMMSAAMRPSSPRAVGRPVRVQLTRAQETAWEPKGTAQLMEISGGLTPQAMSALTISPSATPPTARRCWPRCSPASCSPVPTGLHHGRPDRDPALSTTRRSGSSAHDMPPIVRASWLRGVSSMPNTFAHECYIDEAAADAGVDPIEYRLRYLQDPRAIDLVKAMAERVGLGAAHRARIAGRGGRHPARPGLRLCVYVHGQFPGMPAAWSAWVADVEVEQGRPATSR